MGKNRLLILVGLVAALAIVAILIGLKGGGQTVDLKEDGFSVSNANEIDRIVLSNTNGDIIDLTRIDDTESWRLNGEYVARKSNVSNLLRALKGQRIRYPLTDDGNKKALEQMLLKSVDVDVYKGGEEPILSFKVGGTTPDGVGTIMFIKKNGKLARNGHAVHLPGFEGELGPRYATNLEAWRSLAAFSYNPSQIKSIKVDYLQYPNDGFKLSRIGEGQLDIQPLNPSAKINAAPDPLRMQTYVQYYMDASVEGYDNDYAKKDSILMNEPYCRITLETTDGETDEMTVYYKPISKGTKMRFDVYGNPMNYDVDRYFAVINDGQDFALIQFYVWGKFFRTYPEFFEMIPAATDSPT